MSDILYDPSQTFFSSSKFYFLNSSVSMIFMHHQYSLDGYKLNYEYFIFCVARGLLIFVVWHEMCGFTHRISQIFLIEWMLFYKNYTINIIKYWIANDLICQDEIAGSSNIQTSGYVNLCNKSVGWFKQWPPASPQCNLQSACMQHVCMIECTYKNIIVLTSISPNQ